MLVEDKNDSPPEVGELRNMIQDLQNKLAALEVRQNGGTVDEELKSKYKKLLAGSKD